MSGGPVRRLFRTVLFTDIVGSTELAARLGDRRWRRTLAQHHALIRREIKRHRGREVDTAGDGFFAIFESPTDAVRTAAAAVAGVHGLGLRIRAGIHTGEVEPAGAKFGGIAVHIGARLLAMAGMEEVLVSSTVRDLVVGSDLVLEDRGVHELRGIPGEWRVYSLVLPALDESIAVGAADDDEARLAATTRRNRLVTGGLLGVIAVLLVGLAAAYLVGSRPAAPLDGPDTLIAYDAGGGRVAAGWRVGRGPSSVALDGSIAWVASADAGIVSRVDLGTSTSTSIGQAGTRPMAVIASPSRAWIADRFESRIAVLDSRSGALLERLAVHAAALALDGGRLWVADDLAERLIAFDTATNAQIAEIQLPRPSGPTALASAAGALWVAAPRADMLWRVDPATGAVSSVVTALAGVDVVVAAGDDVWVASSATDKVARLDAVTGRVEVRVDVCDTPVAVADAADGVWIACAISHEAWRLSDGGEILERITLNGSPVDIVTDQRGRALIALRAT